MQPIYLLAQHQFLIENADDKSLRQQLKTQGVDARRLSRFSQLALLGALPLQPQISPNTSIYLGSRFASPSKFNKMFQQLNQQDLPSPLDFMANLNNAATFQLAQTLHMHGTTLFLAVNAATLLQPLQLATLELQKAEPAMALVGWAWENPDPNGKHGSHWLLLSNHPPENATPFVQGEKELRQSLHNLFQIV
ncbi:MAG: beta-ketoacyl synthase chain length factor [Pasteurellaceae bacterium]|nr:beta-ketoacyl synthase chain length factor [Pasteurellaceae bacterium]